MTGATLQINDKLYYNISAADGMNAINDLRGSETQEIMRTSLLADPGPGGKTIVIGSPIFGPGVSEDVARMRVCVGYANMIAMMAQAIAANFPDSATIKEAATLAVRLADILGGESIVLTEGPGDDTDPED